MIAANNEANEQRVPNGQVEVVTMTTTHS